MAQLQLQLVSIVFLDTNVADFTHRKLQEISVCSHNHLDRVKSLLQNIKDRGVFTTELIRDWRNRVFFKCIEKCQIFNTNLLGFILAFIIKTPSYPQLNITLTLYCVSDDYYYCYLHPTPPSHLQTLFLQ